MLKLLQPVICDRNSVAILRESKRYAGHSKWQNIKHIKAAKDNQRASNFARLSRMMRVAITEGNNANPDANSKLAQLIAQAKRNYMPAATINKILKDAQAAKTNAKSAIFEVRGPGGCIILIEVFTDNLSLIRMTLNTIMRKNNCSFADSGARHLFHHKGIVETEMVGDLETATEHAIQIGAEDVQIIEKGDKKLFQFVCEPESLQKVNSQLEELKYKLTLVETQYVAHTLANLNDTDLKQVETMFDKLNGLEDVVRLHDNIA